MRTIVSVGERVRETRQERQMSQLELAVKAGVTPATIGRIELGHTEPRVGTLRALAKALSVPPADLLGD